MSKWQTKDEKSIKDFEINEVIDKPQRHDSILMDENQIETT